MTEVLRAGARRLLAEAVEAEVEAFIVEHADVTDDGGCRRVVRHGCSGSEPNGPFQNRPYEYIDY